jgi:hypothetical protein
MPLSANERAFAELGEALARNMVAMLARILNQSTLVDFELDAVGEAQRNLLFDLSVLAIAVFEDRQGIDQRGQRHFPRVTFEIGNSSGEPDLIYSGVILHGLVEDPILDAGVARARE